MTQQDDIEAQIKALEPTAPRVTLADLDVNIVDTEIVKHVMLGGQVLRWAVLTTQNGFAVTGRPSVSVSPENDNEQMGKLAAIYNARNELWQLMGYALKQKLWEERQVDAAVAESVAGISFDELVQHGLDVGAETYMGAPLSFQYKGQAVSHENDSCYLIGAHGTHFYRGQRLWVGADGQVLVGPDPALKNAARAAGISG